MRSLDNTTTWKFLDISSNGIPHNGLDDIMRLVKVCSQQHHHHHPLIDPSCDPREALMEKLFMSTGKSKNIGNRIMPRSHHYVQVSRMALHLASSSLFYYIGIPWRRSSKFAFASLRHGSRERSFLVDEYEYLSTTYNDSLFSIRLHGHLGDDDLARLVVRLLSLWSTRHPVHPSTEMLLLLLLLLSSTTKTPKIVYLLGNVRVEQECGSFAATISIIGWLAGSWSFLTSFRHVFR
jgi:hypothetical protein